jgi:hypothetical protein
MKSYFGFNLDRRLRDGRPGGFLLHRSLHVTYRTARKLLEMLASFGSQHMMLRFGHDFFL